MSLSEYRPHFTQDPPAIAFNMDVSHYKEAIRPYITAYLNDEHFRMAKEGSFCESIVSFVVDIILDDLASEKLYDYNDTLTYNENRLYGLFNSVMTQLENYADASEEDLIWEVLTDRLVSLTDTLLKVMYPIFLSDPQFNGFFNHYLRQLGFFPKDIKDVTPLLSNNSHWASMAPRTYMVHCVGVATCNA